jgi:hypothetical protein
MQESELKRLRTRLEEQVHESINIKQTSHASVLVYCNTHEKDGSTVKIHFIAGYDYDGPTILGMTVNREVTYKLSLDRSTDEGIFSMLYISPDGLDDIMDVLIGETSRPVDPVEMKEHDLGAGQ